MRFLRTQASTDTHISTFTLPLDFDPPPSLCISYELSEKTQWIEWQRSKARPSNRPGWRGDGWLCVYECVCAYICVCVCVCLTHTRYSQDCVCMWIWICLSIVCCVFTHSRPSLHILRHETTTYACTHTSSMSLDFEVWSGRPSDRFLISADPHMPWNWYAGPALTSPLPSIWYTHWLDVGVTHKWPRLVTVWPTTCEKSREKDRSVSGSCHVIWYHFILGYTY